MRNTARVNRRSPQTCDILVTKVKGRATTRLLTLLIALIACFTAPVATAEVRRAPQGIVCVSQPRPEHREIHEPRQSGSQPKSEEQPGAVTAPFGRGSVTGWFLYRPLFQRPPPSFLHS